MSSPPVKRALISVSDKEGLSEFAAGLVDAGVEIYSTGGTRRHLEESGLSIKDVAEYTGFPEMMDGRVKTLHPRIFAGLLCRFDREDDMQSLAEHDISTFELIVVNLYPFQQTIAREGVTQAEAIEQIDIGGPSLVRAAAKNHKFVNIVTDKGQYDRVLSEIKDSGTTSLETRFELASDAFAMTADYDAAISDYFISQSGTAESSVESSDDAFADTISVELKRSAVLRYGENPHQKAAVYEQLGISGPSLVRAKQLNGKELSYNNLLDLDAAYNIAQSYTDSAVSVIKHNNPCGAAVAENIAEATKNAMAGDPLSAFGSVLGFNQQVDEAAAEVLAEPGLFIEAIAAPSFSSAAVEILTTRPKWKANVRLMEMGDGRLSAGDGQLRQIAGALLLQDGDTLADAYDEWQVVTEAQLDESLEGELRFAWQIVRHIKSNAIAICRNRSLVGAGAGQMSRVDSVEISIRKAGDRVQGAVLSSDAFFPFPDSIHAAADAGIAAIIQPGGSRRDDEVIAACNERRIPMVFTGRRHFKH